MNCSEKLRNLRIQRGLTQMELANQLNTSQSSITSWENGRREPDFATLKKLAEFFNVPLSAVLPNDDNFDTDYIYSVSESISSNPKLKELFEIARLFSNDDIGTLLAVANSLKAKYGN